MGLIKCIEIAEPVILDALDDFASEWYVSTEGINKVMKVCDVADGLTERFGGISADVSIDEDKAVHIKVETGYIVIKDADDLLYSAMELADKTEFSRSGSNNLYTEFILEDVFKKSI